VARHLQQAGHQVVLGSRKAVSRPNCLSQTEVVQTDWNDSRALKRICTGVDVVIHAAGMNAQDCAADPVAALELNGSATARLLREAIQAGVTRFIYLSTAHVYASPLVGSIDETACPRNLHPYATSHLAGENAVLGSRQRREIDGIVLRLSNVFGAPAHRDANCWMLLVNDLCRNAAVRGEMPLRSSGLQQRDFIAMADVCRAIEHLSSGNVDLGELGVINVGSGKSQSVIEMAQLIQRRCELVLGFKPRLLRPEIGADERNEILEYRADRLANLGFNMILDKGFEIDELLAYCHAEFNQEQGSHH